MKKIPPGIIITLYWLSFSRVGLKFGVILLGTVFSMADAQASQLPKSNLPRSLPTCSSKDLTLNKGIGKVAKSCPANFSNSFQNWHILRQDLSLPAVILDMEVVTHNLAWMEEFLANFDAPVYLAPHGKTSMMPGLLKEVMASSPQMWGVTMATSTHVRVGHTFGIAARILMANQLMGRRDMEIISEIMKQDPNFEFYCIIDSPKNVEELGKFFKERGQRLQVLLEYGPPTQHGGRGGIRTQCEEEQVLSSLKPWTQSGTLSLVGVEFFEGVLFKEDDVLQFLDFVTNRSHHLLKIRAFSQQQNDHNTGPILIAGGGSVWFDLVAEKLTNFYSGISAENVKILLTPGSYIFHGIEMFVKTENRILAKGLMTSRLRPALKIWVHVLSLPDSGLAIIGFGQRDVAIDSGYPKHTGMQYRLVGGNFEMVQVQPGRRKKWEIFRMVDHHSFMRIKKGDDIQVGDVLLFDIIHPCTTLDKWRHVVAIDNERDMNFVEVYPTFF